MEDTLKQVEAAEEQAKPSLEEQGKPSSEEQAKPTSEEPKDTPSGKVYTQEEYSKAQSAWMKQLREMQEKYSKAEAAAKANAETLQEIQQELEMARQKRYELEEQLAESSDDPDKAKRAITLLRKAEEREAELRQREMKLKLKEDEIYQYARIRRAEELNKEYGVPVDDVLTAPTEEGMVNKALMYALAKVREAKPTDNKTEETPPTKPPFDSGISSAGVSNDEQFMKDYASGKSDDHKRAQEILQKKLKGG